MMTPTHHTGQWLGSQLPYLLATHQYEGGGAVVDGRSVGRSHRAILVEHRLQARNLVELRLARTFVRVDAQDIALSSWDLDRSNLIAELAVLDRFLRALKALNGVIVLILA